MNIAALCLVYVQRVWHWGMKHDKHVSQLHSKHQQCHNALLSLLRRPDHGNEEAMKEKNKEREGRGWEELEKQVYEQQELQEERCTDAMNRSRQPVSRAQGFSGVWKHTPVCASLLWSFGRVYPKIQLEFIDRVCSFIKKLWLVCGKCCVVFLLKSPASHTFFSGYIN